MDYLLNENYSKQPNASSYLSSDLINDNNSNPLNVTFNNYNFFNLFEDGSSVSSLFETLTDADSDIFASSLYYISKKPNFINDIGQEQTIQVESNNFVLQKENPTSSYFEEYLSIGGQPTSNVFEKSVSNSILFNDKILECGYEVDALHQLWPCKHIEDSPADYSTVSLSYSISRSSSNSITFSPYASHDNNKKIISPFFYVGSDVVSKESGNTFATPEGRRSLYIDLLQQLKRLQPIWAEHEKSFDYHFYELLKCHNIEDFTKYDVIFKQLLIQSEISGFKTQVTPHKYFTTNPIVNPSSSIHTGLSSFDRTYVPLYLRVIDELDLIHTLSNPMFKPLSRKILMENVSLDNSFMTNFDQSSFLNANLCESDSIKQQVLKNSVHQWKDHSIYEGDFRSNCIQGYGVRNFVDGSVYDEKWRDNAIHGHGNITTAHGYYYDDQFNQNKKNGIGKGTYGDSSGLKYIRSLKFGQLNNETRQINGTNSVQYGDSRDKAFIKLSSKGYKNDNKDNALKNKQPNALIIEHDVYKKDDCVFSGNFENSLNFLSLQNDNISSTMETTDTQTNETLDITQSLANNISRNRSKNMQLKAWINETKRLPKHPQVNFNKVLGRWYAIIKNPKTGKRTWKGFSCTIYGFKRARQLAIDWVTCNNYNSACNNSAINANKSNEKQGLNSNDAFEKETIKFRTKKKKINNCNVKDKKKENELRGWAKFEKIQKSNSNNKRSKKKVKTEMSTNIFSQSSQSTPLYQTENFKDSWEKCISEPKLERSSPKQGFFNINSDDCTNKNNWLNTSAIENCSFNNIKTDNETKLLSFCSSASNENDKKNFDYYGNFSNIAMTSNYLNVSKIIGNDDCHEKNYCNVPLCSVNNENITNNQTNAMDRKVLNGENNKDNNRNHLEVESSDNNCSKPEIFQDWTKIIKLHNECLKITECSDSCNKEGELQKYYEDNITNGKMLKNLVPNWNTVPQNNIIPKVTEFQDINQSFDVSTLNQQQKTPNYQNSFCDFNTLVKNDESKLFDQIKKQNIQNISAFTSKNFSSATPVKEFDLLNQIRQPNHCELTKKPTFENVKKKKKNYMDSCTVWLRQDHWGKGWRCVWIDENNTQRSKFFGESKWGKEGCRQKAENYLELYREKYNRDVKACLQAILN